MLRALAIPAIVLGLGTLAAIVFSLRTNGGPPPTAQAIVRGCTASAGPGVTGLVPASGKGNLTVVQILPAAPYGAAYLNLVRERIGMQPRPAATLTPAQLQVFPQVVRYAAIDRRGRFACRALDPGPYIAVSTTATYQRVDVGVAAFDVRTGSDATLPPNRFKPLQAIQ